MNPYLVVDNIGINQVQDEANKQWNNGYEVFNVLPTGGGNIAIVFVLRTATVQRPKVAGAYSSGN